MFKHIYVFLIAIVLICVFGPSEGAPYSILTPEQQKCRTECFDNAFVCYKNNGYNWHGWPYRMPNGKLNNCNSEFWKCKRNKCGV